ncbi:MAG: bile acid:sodium symporter [Gammaproteobacteria bacterium]|nr:bile acid:sodium symporter [Gammaproteobacteria bacterium]
MTLESLIRPLTIITVFGLLLSVGLRVKVGQIVEATRDPALVARSLLANFVLAPLAILGLVLFFNLPTPIAIGMMIMAAAPFAPMAPAFAGIAKGNVPVAAGHMVIYSILAVVVTPVLCRLLFRALPNADAVEFNIVAIIISLLLTVFLPLSIGIAIHSLTPKLAARLSRPVNVSSLVILGVAVVLIFIDRFEALSALEWKVFLAMILSTEISLAIGYALGGPSVSTRRSIGLGTAVRNIGVAILIATGSFADSPALLSVLAYSLIVITLGLAHSVFWGRKGL